MRKIAEQLYNSMQRDLQNCKIKNADEEKQTECCFQICYQYYQLLERCLLVYQFSCDEEEFDFFKNCKPMFTSQIEYYNLVYHTCLFRPLDEQDKETFWNRELLRLERFAENHKTFYQYYLEQQTSMDAEWFLRRNKTAHVDCEKEVLWKEKQTCTSHDHLMAQVKALEKYKAYVQHKITQ